MIDKGMEWLSARLLDLAGILLILMGVILLLCALAYAGLCRITWIDALRAFNRGEFSMGGVSMLIWPSRFILPVSFGLGCLVCLWHLGGLMLSGRVRNRFTS